MAPGASTGIDELFQLPLNEFTAARNALAKRAGKDGADIRALAKPPVAAWAVNQLYWKDRERYDDLVRAAVEMRKAHTSVIEGKRADLRTAGREHELAIAAALESTIGLLEQDGQTVTEATRQAILNTLRALPSADQPGRLTRTLSPGGFEMLAGIAAAPPASGKPRPAPATAARPKASGGTAAADARAAREAAKLREQKAAAERAIRDADQRARQAEFEVARTRRDATKAEKRLEQARQAFEEARKEVTEAERDAERAAKARAAAEKRSEEAAAALDRARSSRLP